MPRTVNPIKKAKVKRALLQGKSARQALAEGGYSPATVSHSTENTVVRRSMQEMLQELKLSDITVDYIARGYIDIIERCLTKQDYATAKSAYDSLAKWRNMFHDYELREDKRVQIINYKLEWDKDGKPIVAHKEECNYSDVDDVSRRVD